MNINKLKTSIAAGVVLAVIFIVTSVIGIREVVKCVENQNRIYVEEVTSQLSNNISDNINWQLRELDLILKSISFKEGITFEDIQKVLLEEFVRGGFLQILISDVNGNAKGVDGKNIYIGDRKYFKATLENKYYISNPMESRIDGKNVITYSMPIVYKAKVVGVLCGMSDADTILNKVSTEIYNENRCSMLVDLNGKIIHSNHNSAINRKHSDTEIRDAFLLKYKEDKRNKRLDVGFGKSVIQGQERYIGYSKVEITKDWYIVTAIPEGSILNDAENIISISINILFIISIAGILLIFYLSALKKTNDKKLEKATFEDNLTEISNYEKFVIDSKKYLEKPKDVVDGKYALICFDIKKLKLINDIYGYKVGDNILISISNNLKKYYYNRSVYGRLSGDVFAILTEADKDISLDDISYMVANFKKKVTNIDSEKIFHLNISIGIDIGIYFIEDKNMDIKRMIGYADIARLKSKDIAGSEYVIFDENVRKEKQALLQLEQDLYFAIKEKQFKMYYQPKYDYNKEKIVGSEALIRWYHPTIGVVSPFEFITIAEKNGFINEIGKWVIEDVFYTIDSLIKEGIEVVPVSINLSRVELYQEDVVGYLEKMIKKYNVDPNLIEIEITETTTLNDVDFISEKIHGIKKLGIKVSMDDFGTGNSNLSNLKNIPIDTLKVDKSLIIDIEDDDRTRLLIKSIVDLCRALDLKIVGEGVENNSQVQILKEIGIDIVQGYVFSRPVSIEEYKRILSRNGESQA